MLDLLNSIQTYISPESLKWILPIIIFSLFVLSFRLFAKMLGKTIEKILKTIGIDSDDELSKTLKRPLRLLVLVVGIVITLKLTPFFPQSMQQIVDKISQAFILFFAFQILYFLIQPIGQLLQKSKWLMSDLMASLLTKLLKFSVVLIGGVSILEIMSIEVAPIIAGFGLLGVAVALGAQDLFKNMIGGLLILAEKRFDIGDWIKAEGVIEGIVEDISFRSTLIRTFDQAPVQVPNNNLAASILTNYSRLPCWRINWTIGVEYKTTTKQLKQTCQNITTMLENHEKIISDNSVPFQICVNQFSDSAIDILIICFVNTKHWSEYLKIKQEIALTIKDILQQINVNFAFPSQSLYVETIPKT